MKKIYAALILFAVLVHGCTSEITDKCPPVPNLILNFSYTDENGEEVFTRSIESVYVYVFDENRYLAGSRYVSGAELERMQGVEWVLDEGDYSVVCWGNIGQQDTGNSASWSSLYLSGFENLAQQAYYAPERDIITRSTDNYVPFTVNVPRKGFTEATIDFMPAARTVDVYVKGLEDVSAGSRLAPRIELAGVPAGYDFYMEAIREYETYSRSSEYVSQNGVDVAEAGFRTPYFAVTEEIQVIIYKQSNGNIAHAVILKDFLDAAGIDPGISGDISILIEFRNGQAILSVPDWDTTVVEPEL